MIALYVVPAGAGQYSTPVHAGDWTKYQISGDLSENVKVTNQTVTQVLGTNVTVKSTDFYKDGTNSSEFLWVDVATGQNNTAQSGFPAFFFVILPGRSIRQGVYGVPSLVIQNSFQRTYVNASRQTNFANITTLGSGSTSYYWDAQTGILAEILQLHQNQTVAIHALLVGTSLWVPGENTGPSSSNLPTVLAEVAGVGLIAALAIILGYFRLTRKRRAKKGRTARK